MKVQFCSILLAFAGVSAFAQTALDNDAVLQLIRAGIKDEVIAGIIQSQPGHYTTGTDSLNALRQAGASPQLIAAVMNHGTGQPVLSPPDPNTETAIILRDGTPIRLRLNRTLSSEDAAVGQKVDFDVLDDIRVNDQVVIPRGSKAIGAITEAEHKKRMARGGKLNLGMEHITLDNGTKVALRATKEAAGGGHAGAMTAGIVATALVTWPAAPLFLMMHGKSAVIPEATEVTAYTDGDVPIARSDLRMVSRLR